MYNQYLSLQRGFVEYMKDQSNTDFENLVLSKYPKERINIYRNNILSNLKHVLSITYPGVWKLLGEDCADNVANLFLKNIDHFPESACLDDWGKKFPDFLETIQELQDINYLKEYAIYEWLKHEVNIAPENNSINLSTVDKDKFTLKMIDKVQIQLVKSYRLYLFKFPVYEIENSIFSESQEIVTLTSKNSYLLLNKNSGKLTISNILPEIFHLVQMLENQISLVHALDLVIKQYPKCNVKNLLFYLLHKELIEHFAT
ncbi:HvfC/BufC N-terminal domain-containing protein [Rickettsia endosymbiont of Cardiosporidium cionae]|uniref:HvfC/BufC N-terminal domain-containing protein n=1 Tax=Rickettsia endosymbiont of Cardiosporidium cionae TaxID=2777155 RepID=UPI00226BC31F|nr:DNA-binding domain-containing protein [Rickettsia endosymbiont of Cardiosporidium cionae]KAF8818536.1 hypothetical protein IHI24_000252 [Rickettsia endosymbiont of Cardiosporidium cionae]